MFGTNTHSLGRKTASAHFRVRIAVFKSICFCVVLIAVALIGSEEISNIAAIKTRAEDTRQNRLPEFTENQKTLANIESLRRLAEITNLSDTPKDRRNARISATALTSESIFDTDPSFRSSAQKVAEGIKELVAGKNQMDELFAAIVTIETQYYNTLVRLARLVSNEDDLAYILHLNTRRLVENPSKSHFVLEQEQQRTQEQLTRLATISEAVSSANPAEKKAAAQYLAEITATMNKRLHTVEQLVSQDNEVQAVWRVIDKTLRSMRDNVATGSEFAISSALDSIKILSAQVLRSSIGLYGIILFFFAAYYVSVHMLIIRPLRWTSEKLQAIQQGNLDVSPSKIYIEEIAVMAELLDTFSGHLAELYSHANQLEEDALKKRNLEAIMHAVFKVSLDGYVVWDAREIKTVSEGARNLLGIASDAEALPCWQKDDTLEKQARELHDHLAETAAWREEVTLMNAAGAPIPCERTHLRIRFNNEQCFLSYIRDLRDQKKNEHALVTAKEQAEVATQAKSEFLARMSHEIRTPMNGVIGLTRLALESSPSPRQQELLEKIQASAQILLGVINDILDFSKIEQGKLVLESKAFSINQLFATITDLLESQADKKHIAFDQHIDRDFFARTMVEGDYLRLSQVLLNLCGNAVKFTEKGAVALWVECLEQSDTHVTVRFRVTDTGIGMTEAQIAGLFQAFAQADSSTTRKYGGTGLGLMISKLLVDQMGGTIEVRSSINAGSEFSFTLRLPVARMQEHTPDSGEAQHDTDAILAGKRILVAEDNEINQEIIRTFMEDLGVLVTMAATGQEALDILESHDFDCILMDIQMPVMDGLTATRIIRAQGRDSVRNLPIIAMTAHVLQEDIEKSLDAGMNAHLTKPIDYQKFIDCLNNYLGSH